MKNIDVANGVKQLFNHRKQVLILGLTGRTGSGCTTLASVLQTKNFTDLNVRDPKIPPKNHEDRKFRVVYDWISSNWNPFKKISVSEIISGFILLQGFDKFFNYLENLCGQSQSHKDLDLQSLSKLKYEFSKLTDLALSTSLWENDLLGPPAPKDHALNFLFNELPGFSKIVRAALAEKSPDLDSFFFQTIGDNIRRSGNPYCTTVDPSKLFTIPKILERIVQQCINDDSLTGKPTYIVIDAIRHPYEARYLQERYSYFYLIAVTADNEQRRSRLVEMQFRADEILRLDVKEYPREKKKGKLEGYDLLVSQDIQSSIENADIYLFNPDDDSSRNSPHALKEQILRYISLMMHPGLVTPTSVERCMQSAFTAKLNSGCISRQVGAVVADKNFSVKAIGWNDVPKGQVPCSLRNARHLYSKQDPLAFSRYEDGVEFKDHLSKQPIVKINLSHYEGRNLSYCFKSHYNQLIGIANQVHTRALHAEENAFLQLAKSAGQVVDGGYLFTTASPCELCAKKAYQLGVDSIFFIDPYPGISKDHVLASGLPDQRPKLVQFTGAVGRTYHQLFSPIMSIKDEITFLVQ